MSQGAALGWSGGVSELFFRDNTMMFFGDAKKKMCEEVVKAWSSVLAHRVLYSLPP